MTLSCKQPIHFGSLPWLFSSNSIRRQITFTIQYHWLIQHIESDILSFKNLPSRLPSNEHACMHSFFFFLFAQWTPANAFQVKHFVVASSFQNHQVSSSPLVTSSPQATHRSTVHIYCKSYILNQQLVVFYTNLSGLFTSFRDAAFPCSCRFQTLFLMTLRTSFFFLWKDSHSQSRRNNSPIRASARGALLCIKCNDFTNPHTQYSIFDTTVVYCKGDATTLAYLVWIPFGRLFRPKAEDTQAKIGGTCSHHLDFHVQNRKIWQVTPAVVLDACIVLYVSQYSSTDSSQRHKLVASKPLNPPVR